MENILDLNLTTIKSPKSPVSEAYRTLRSNIDFSSIDNKIKSVLISSSGPGEGKSTTSANLAIVMAENEKKTILIDCDLRKPKIHKLFNLSNAKGLSNYLVEQDNLEDILQNTNIKNLNILTSGTKVPNPSELLNSNKMCNFINQLKEKYDFIILDTPPVNLVTDAQILSQIVDGVLLVVACGEAERDSILRANELLKKVNGKIIGVVLNKFKVSLRAKHQYYTDAYYNEDENNEADNIYNGSVYSKNNYDENIGIAIKEIQIKNIENKKIEDKKMEDKKTEVKKIQDKKIQDKKIEVKEVGNKELAVKEIENNVIKKNISKGKKNSGKTKGN